MKTVQVIESLDENGTEWIISLTDSNPEAKDCFVVADSTEAFRVKEMLEVWGNRHDGYHPNFCTKK